MAVVLFWLVFAVLMLIEDEVALRIAGTRTDPVDRLQYIIRFVLWTLLTPLIIALSIRFPIRRSLLFTGIIRHFFFAMLIIGLEFIIEIPIIRFATLRMLGKVPPVIDYATVFILKLNIYLLLYFLVVGVTWLVLNLENSTRSALLAKEAELKNKQLETQLTEAKLALLKMQLDPHFLFNTHHSIISLMMNNENDKAVKMLSLLSDLLRLSLAEEQQMVPLEKEMQMLKLYLDIQQIRFQERLDVVFSVDPRTLSERVPSFILQPIVENAIKHGISASSHTGRLNIRAKIDGNTLVLTVDNDGAVIDFDYYREGIGLANTKERLYQIYGNRSKFELKNLPEGVSAIITIPTD